MMTVTLSLDAQSFFDKLSGGLNFDVKSPQTTLRDRGLTEYYGMSAEIFYYGCTDKTFRFTPGYRFAGGLTKRISGNQVTLAQPLGAQATEELFNAYWGLELVGRLIYDKHERLRPYMEVFSGPRFTSGHEVLALNEPVPGFENATEKVFGGSSLSSGLNLGALVKLGDVVDLNLRAGMEYTGMVSHSDFNREAAYSIQEIQTPNTFIYNFSIGITFRPTCGRVCSSSRRSSSNDCVAPPSFRNTYTQPVKVSRT